VQGNVKFVASLIVHLSRTPSRPDSLSGILWSFETKERELHARFDASQALRDPRENDERARARAPERKSESEQKEEKEKERALERVRATGETKRARRREIPLSSCRQFDLGRSAHRRRRGRCTKTNEAVGDGSASARFFSAVPAAVGVACAGSRVRAPRERTEGTERCGRCACVR